MLTQLGLQHERKEIRLTNYILLCIGEAVDMLAVNEVFAVGEADIDQTRRTMAHSGYDTAILINLSNLWKRYLYCPADPTSFRDHLHRR